MQIYHNIEVGQIYKLVKEPPSANMKLKVSIGQKCIIIAAPDTTTDMWHLISFVDDTGEVQEWSYLYFTKSTHTIFEIV